MTTKNKRTHTHKHKKKPVCKPKNIPPPLKKIDHWVTWRYEDHGGKKQSKVPYQVNSERAKINDPSHWVSFEEANEFRLKQGFDGLGFVLTENDDIIGIDIDNCIFEDGTLSELAEEIIRLCGSYSEISPSGKGIRIFMRGEYPPGDKYLKNNKELGLEIYNSNRYLTVTGDIYEAEDKK